MGNSQSKLKRKSNKLKVVKRTITFLSVAPDLEVVRAVIKIAPNTVIGALSNGAINCRQGAVHIPLHLIPLFKRHNKHFDYLVDRIKINSIQATFNSSEGWCSFYYCFTVYHSSWLNRWRIYIEAYAQK